MVLLDLSVLLALAWHVSVVSAGLCELVLQVPVGWLVCWPVMHDQGVMIKVLLGCLLVSLALPCLVMLCVCQVFRVLACVSGLALLPVCLVKFCIANALDVCYVLACFCRILAQELPEVH